VDAAFLVASLVAVVAVRLQLLWAAPFPINDGALFLVFVQATAHTFPGLPATVDYNGAAIPFAYPPLAFWLAAGAVRLGLSPLAVVQVAPVFMNIAYVLLFALLLLRTGHARLFTALAVLIAGMTFRSYEWLVMGGGLSRGLGSVLLLLTLLALLPPGLWRDGRWSWRRLVAGGACLGGTVLSHLEWGLLCTVCALLCLAMARRRLGAWLAGAFVLGAVSLLVVLPWLVAVLHEHGLAPFAAASRTGSWRPSVLAEGARMLLRNSAQLLPFVVVGAVLAARSRDVFWLVFAVLPALLIPRSGETPLVLGIGVLAATGLIGVVAAAARWRSRLGWPTAIALVLTGVGLTAARVGDTFRRDELFAPLSPEVRSAMAWVAAQHPGRRFTLVREAPWYYNASAEWFPVLAHAVNNSTAQGREWLPDDVFGQTYAAIDDLNASTTCEALLESVRAFGPADFVWVEGVDLAARAAALEALYARRSVAERAAAAWRRMRGEPAPDPRRGKAGALRGPGTAGGCFDAAGWREVLANPRVRIFQPPGAAAQ
jgi:hypothetical protein